MEIRDLEKLFDSKLETIHLKLDNVVSQTTETNGKVAEVVKWKMENQGFISKLKSKEHKLLNVLNSYTEKQATKKGLWNSFLAQILTIIIAGVVSLLGACYATIKFIK